MSRLRPILALGSIHLEYHSDTVGVSVWVWVFDITYSPHHPLHPPGVHSPIIWLERATPACVKIVSDPCPRLHPPFVSLGTLCVGVCVCVFDIACSSHPALHLPDAHSPFIYLVGGHAHMCQYCFQSLSEAQSTLCITGDTVCVCVGVCVCVFDIACSSHPALHLPDAHSPFIYLVGGHAHMCQYCFQSLSEAQSTLCITGDTVCVCVCVCVCVFDIACSSYPALHLQDCFQSLSEAQSTLCITGDTVCVCVCMFAIACSPHHPPHTPNVHSPLI